MTCSSSAHQKTYFNSPLVSIAKILTFAGVLFMNSVASNVQANRIDIVRPDAPQLADFGHHHIGVRTLTLIDHGRIDIMNTRPGAENAVYNRSITVEVWYPAQLKSGQSPGGEYQVITRNPKITAKLSGRAVRDADPYKAESAYPLVIISHGWPGNRYLMSHLGENLASKGFVAVSIDHPDSTYDDQQEISSTLFNRPLDQRFVITSVAALSKRSNSFLAGIVDVDNTGIVGYSMGGYGLVNNLGGGFNDELVAIDSAPPNELLALHATGNPGFRNNLDPRIRAGFAIAPWGMREGIWRPQDLAGIETPTFYVAGDKDTTSGYEDGVRALYQGAVNSERYLLTYENAGHNAGAPMPVPREILESPTGQGADHYIDPVWDNVRMNNVMNHFATAFFTFYLKGDASMLRFLNLNPDSKAATNPLKSEATQPSLNHWQGFEEGSAVGLKLEKLRRGEG